MELKRGFNDDYTSKVAEVYVRSPYTAKTLCGSSSHTVLINTCKICELEFYLLQWNVFENKIYTKQLFLTFKDKIKNIKSKQHSAYTAERMFQNDRGYALKSEFKHIDFWESLDSLQLYANYIYMLHSPLMSWQRKVKLSPYL